MGGHMEAVKGERNKILADILKQGHGVIEPGDTISLKAFQYMSFLPGPTRHFLFKLREDPSHSFRRVPYHPLRDPLQGWLRS